MQILLCHILIIHVLLMWRIIMTTEKGGRPTIYTEELAEEICHLVATNGKGIRRICKEHDHLPNPDTIYTWIKKYERFAEQYARAKKKQIEVFIDEIIEISDDSSEDKMINENGKLVTNHEHIHRSRLRVDTRKWLASKLLPKLYGGGSEGENKEDKTNEILEDIRDTVHKCMKPIP